MGKIMRKRKFTRRSPELMYGIIYPHPEPLSIMIVEPRPMMTRKIETTHPLLNKNIRSYERRNPR